MAAVSLAEALGRRRELQQRIDRMKTINNKELFKTTYKRVSVSEGVDDLTIQSNVIAWRDFDREYNALASQLRKLDALIQQANWTTTIQASHLMTDPEVSITE